MRRCESISDGELLEKVLSHPLTASVFVYLRQQNQPLGVREIQKALNLGSPSTAHWHLNKLLNEGIVEQIQGNKYQILEPYNKVRKIPMTIVLDHYLIGGKAVPGVFLLMTFLIITSIAVFLGIIFGLWPIAAFMGFFALVVSTVLVTQFYLQFLKLQK